MYYKDSLSKTKAMVLKKAIYMDLFQIGEHITNMSPEIKKAINQDDVRGIIDTRNIIGHGYKEVDPDVIKDSIEQNCPNLISQLKELFE